MARGVAGGGLGATLTVQENTSLACSLEKMSDTFGRVIYLLGYGQCVCVHVSVHAWVRVRESNCRQY